MTTRGGAGALGLLALMAGPAQADFFYTSDLGGGLAVADCLARGQAAFEAYVAQSGSTSATVHAWNWAVEVRDLLPGGIDAQILCPYRDGVVPVVLMVMHVANSYADHSALMNAIVAVWEATPAPAAPAVAAEPAAQPEPEPAPLPAPASK